MLFYHGTKKCRDELTANGKPLLFNMQKILIGNHVIINNGVQIALIGNVVTDDYVVLSRGSQITAGQLDASKRVGAIKILRMSYISEGAWFCVNSIVLPEVNISVKGVIVTAGAVVTKDITEDYVIVGGVSARIVKGLGD